jgi:hypothetical protein
MEADLDLCAVIRAALLLDGHRVECVADCAGVLAWRDNVGSVPDEFVLGLGAGELDPEWETLKLALDDDAVLSRAAVIVLLTIRNGLTFPARARILQSPSQSKSCWPSSRPTWPRRRPARLNTRIKAVHQGGTVCSRVGRRLWRALDPFSPAKSGSSTALEG